MISVSRRSFLQRIASVLAAPAIVRFESIMPVKVPPLLIEKPIIVFEITGGARVVRPWEYGFEITKWKVSSGPRLPWEGQPSYQYGTDE